MAQIIFWSGWWRHLTWREAEKSFPDTSVIELGASALALWSYQKEEGEGKEGPHLFQTNFPEHWERLLHCLWALSRVDDIADKLGICFCHWQESILKRYLIYRRCIVSFFFFFFIQGSHCWQFFSLFSEYWNIWSHQAGCRLQCWHFLAQRMPTSLEHLKSVNEQIKRTVAWSS